MQHHVLPAGTRLDDRYEIESLLGEGGFGITYAARNIRLDLKVAIKELFWRDHSTRDAAVSPEVALRKPEDDSVFRKQKERFLAEARTIVNFSNQGDIAGVLDYFEANGTAYIVMEFVEGETLSAVLQRQGPIPAQELFQRFLPLVESLAAIHRRRVIHRDISPDNIMVQPDGRLKLIDFGAAREYETLGGMQHSVIAKDSYAPGEQYDKNGKQGPWTDVYSLCATLYTCVTGQAPLSSVQRMFLDDMMPPSELQADVPAECEAVILRGMELSASKRYQSMDALAEAMRGALPSPAPRKPLKFWLALAAAAVVVLCAAVALGIYVHDSRSEARDRFGDTATESFRLIAPNYMKHEDFLAAQGKLVEILDDFAGEAEDGGANYVVTVDGDKLEVELPLALFEGREISEALNEVLSPMLDDLHFDSQYQIQVDWEDPQKAQNSEVDLSEAGLRSLRIPGKNQVSPQELKGNTAVFAYSFLDKDLSDWDRLETIAGIKARLDVLDAPYAFGTIFGDSNAIAFRMDPAHIGRCVTETVGGYGWQLEIASESSASGYPVPLDEAEIIENDDGSFGLRVRVRDHEAEALRDLSQKVIQQGLRALYLQANKIAVARVECDAPIEDGTIEFRSFMFENLERIDAEHRYILEYFVMLINESNFLPSSVLTRDEGVWDDERGGDLAFDVSVDERLGLRETLRDDEQRLCETLERIQKEEGYEWGSNGSTYFLKLNLRWDEHLVENIATVIPTLLKKYALGTFYNRLTIQLMDEGEGERFRIFVGEEYDVGEDYDFENARYVQGISYIFRYIEHGRTSLSFDADDARPPFTEAFLKWWDEFPAEDYGLVKTHSELEW